MLCTLGSASPLGRAFWPLLVFGAGVPPSPYLCLSPAVGSPHEVAYNNSPITIGIDDNCAILSARRIELNGQKYTQITVVNSEGIQFSDANTLSVVDIPDETEPDDYLGIVQALAARVGTEVTAEEFEYLSNRLF